jgi:hypothetical protein
MRLRLMATYLGVPYQAGLGPDGYQVTLFSPAPPPGELGFAAAGPGHWRKQVSVTDLGALWQSRPVGDYRGERCLVLDDLGDRLHIAYLGRDATRAAQLGYWEIDREVFEVVVARHDVTGLVEVRVEFPLAAAVFPPTGPPSHTGGPAGAVAEMAGRAGYDGAAGNGGSAYGRHASGEPGSPGGAPGNGSSASGNAGSAPGNSSSAPGIGRPEGYGGASHGSHMPDRVAAWHGSPAPEPWAEREPRPEPWAEGEPRPKPWAEREPRSDPRSEREHWSDPRSEREPWSDPGSEREPRPGPWAEREPWSDPRSEREPGSEPEATQVPNRSSGRKDRISPESVFAELLSLAAIPRAAYAVDEEVPGAMCLVEADGGFEVFSRTDNARLEIQFFEDEEAAYFYLFGVLAAEAIRNGRLAPRGPGRTNGHGNGTAMPWATAAAENVSKYLRRRK